MGGEVSKPDLKIGNKLQDLKTRAVGVAQTAAAEGQIFLQNNQKLQDLKTRAVGVAQNAGVTQNATSHNSRTIAPKARNSGNEYVKSLENLTEAVMILSKKGGGSKKRTKTKKRKYSKKRKSKKRTNTKKRKSTKKHRVRFG